jgi:hypothetical protein
LGSLRFAFADRRCFLRRASPGWLRSPASPRVERQWVVR